MRALDWDGTELRTTDKAAPTIGDDEALVRVELAGICNTDLEIVRGYMGFRGTPGHELVGTVVDGPAESRGLRIACEINFACGNCAMCTRGLGRHCPTRTVMGILDADGAFAELVRVPTANLHPLPDAVSDQQAVFVEPLAAAFEILEQVDVNADTSCTVLGDGKLGLLVAQVLATTGADVIAVGKHEDKLAILQARGIKTVTLDDWDAAPRDVVVEASGTARGFTAAAAATRPRGTLVLKTTVAERPDVDLAPLVINEISVVGSRCGPFEPAIAALASGTIDTAPLISDRFSLRDGREAFERAQRPGVLKVLLETAD